jgi:hypothetical protein
MRPGVKRSGQMLGVKFYNFRPRKNRTPGVDFSYILFREKFQGKFLGQFLPTNVGKNFRGKSFKKSESDFPRKNLQKIGK